MFREKCSCVLIMCSKRERCLERSVLVFQLCAPRGRDVWREVFLCFNYVLQEGEMFGEKCSCVSVMCSKRERCLERSVLVF